MGDDERTDHVEHADRLEREVGDMERQSKRVGAEIDDAREEWERKKNDPGVPTAGKDASQMGPEEEPEGEPEGP